MDRRTTQDDSVEPNSLLIDIATRNVICLAADSNVGEAAATMGERRISSIVVTDNAGHPAGIVTERNILRAMQEGCPHEASLDQIMSSPVITVPATTTTLDAYRHCLNHGIRHLVIVDEAGELAGVASETDFRLHLNLTALAGRRRVATVAKRSAVILPPTTSLQQALDLMLTQRKSCVVVVDNEKPVGIVTERDVVRFYSSDRHYADIPLGETMVSPVYTIAHDATTSQAAEEMLIHKLRHLVVVDKDGRLMGLVSEHDLTQAMATGMAEERDGIEENFLRTLINTLPDLVWLKDENGLYLACNARVENFFGAKEQNVVGKSDYDFIDRELADFFREHDQLVMETDMPIVNEEWITYADGRRQLLETIRTPMRDHSGKLLGVLGIGRDITKRKQVEAVLVESESRYRELVENSPFCIHEIDLEGRLQSLNHAGLAMLKLDCHEKIIGKPYLDCANEQDRARLNALMRDAFQGKACHFEFSGTGDVPVFFKSCFIPIRNTDGKVTKLMGITENITERKLSENALREREEIFRSIVDQAPDSIVLFEADTLKFAEFNRMAHERLGYTREAFAALTLADVEAQFSESVLHQRLTLAIANKYPRQFETLHRHKDGSLQETQVSSTPITIRGRAYISSIWSDITGRKRAEEKLRVNASVFGSTQEAIIITDAENSIIDVNPAFTRITGYRREEVLGRNPNLLRSGRQSPAFYKAMWRALQEQGAWRGEIWNRRKSGETYPEMLSINRIYDEHGKVQRHVGIFSDISHIKQHEAELSRVAHYDALTSIPNRVLLADRMMQAIAQTAREQEMMAVCYLDLDGFKPINDNLGHDIGDRVLVETARRIAATIRGGDTVARLGGDEFVILLLGQRRAEECVGTLERLLYEIAQPIAIENNSVTIGASIGVSIYPLDNEEADTLLRHADQAMYLAKQAGKHRFHIYDPSLDQRARDYNEFMKNVRKALELSQFELYYQPKINLKTKQLLGAEALIRWHHPQQGMLPPAEFLHAIENTELDIRIGEWVIETALAQLRQWRQAGLDIEISVNISAYHLESPGFVEMLRQKLEQYPDLPAGSLQIEVLETTALEDVALVNDIILACHKLGVWFALDDFGTGYSSLTYLSRLPVDVLKIDQSFVRDMLEDHGDMAIVKGIIALAHAFKRQIVAEGIETPEHYRTLVELGCELGQGYGIARPMPAHELQNWRAE